MILLTGGTGFLGSALLARLNRMYPDKPIYVLVRAEDDDHALHRLKESNKSLFLKDAKSAKNIYPIAGDISYQGLRLSSKNKDILTQEIKSIYHSAANTHLNLGIDEATACNYTGTANLLEFARSIDNSKLNFKHISTAYVAGDTTQTVCSSNLNINSLFRNSYEETKAKAEKLVQSYKDHFSVIIFRPSVIVGDSITGNTSAFNVLYIPARAIYTGLLKVIPAIPHTPFDVVPVDYVSRIIAESEAMSFENGSCFHLTAGVGRESSPAQILDLLINAAGKYSKNNLKHKPIFAPAEFLSQESIQKVIHSVTNLATNIYHTQTFKHFEKILGNRIPLLNQILPFIPYMISNPRFDTKMTLDKFGPNGLPPLFENYAETIFKFCIESRWGRVQTAQ